MSSWSSTFPAPVVGRRHTRGSVGAAVAAASLLKATISATAAAAGPHASRPFTRPITILTSLPAIRLASPSRRIAIDSTTAVIPCSRRSYYAAARCRGDGWLPSSTPSYAPLIRNRYSYPRIETSSPSSTTWRTRATATTGTTSLARSTSLLACRCYSTTSLTVPPEQQDRGVEKLPAPPNRGTTEPPPGSAIHLPSFETAPPTPQVPDVWVRDTDLENVPGEKFRRPLWHVTTNTFKKPLTVIPVEQAPEPELKTLFSGREATDASKGRKHAPKGTWRYWRDKIFALEGGKVTEISERGWYRWQAILTAKITGWLFLIYSLMGVAIYAAVSLYIEQKDPTPEFWPESVCREFRFIYFYQNIWEDATMAGVAGKAAMHKLEMLMNKLGGWKKLDLEWKRAYFARAEKVADIETSLGKWHDGFVIYRRIASIEQDIVDDTTRARAFARMGFCQSKLGDAEQGLKHFQDSVRWAIKAIPNGKELFPIDPNKPVLPPPTTSSSKTAAYPTTTLIDAIQSVGIQYSRLNRPSDSFPIFLALLRVIQSVPEDKRDRCREASVMAYLGEVIFALGRKEEGFSWSIRALDLSEKEAEDRKVCKDCAVFATDTLEEMVQHMERFKGEEQTRELAALKRRRMRLLNMPKG